ncbi:MAG: hypothetical protein KAR31_04115, partial [Candidatus Omnitrophica bacterium]|nr:hypothetical protein [Candidatus Omnitrophota bacterium]
KYAVPLISPGQIFVLPTFSKTCQMCHYLFPRITSTSPASARAVFGAGNSQVNEVVMQYL